MNNPINKERADKIKKGLINFRFEYLTSFKDVDNGRYVWLSTSPSREYFIVETEHSKTRYYKRFYDALKYFEKNQGSEETWLDLSWPMSWAFGHDDDSILIDELDSVELHELTREE